MRKSKPTAEAIVRLHTKVVRDNKLIEPFNHYQPNKSLNKKGKAA